MSMPIVMVITLRVMDMPNITVILKTLWTIFENLCKKNLRNKVKKEWKKKKNGPTDIRSMKNRVTIVDSLTTVID